MGVSLTNKATGKKYTSSGGTRETVSPAVEQEQAPKVSYSSPSGSIKLTVTEKNANYVAPSKKQEDPSFKTRVVSTVKGTGERQLAGHAGTLENLLTGLGKLGSFLQDKKDAKQAAQDREYLARHEKELADALAAGDEEAAKWAQIKINQAKYRLKTNGDLGDYYDSVTEEAIADVDAFGDKMYAAAEEDFATAKQGANALGRLAVDAGSAVADVATDAVGNLILPGLGTAGRVSRTFGHGSEAAQGKDLGFGKQLAYGATSAAVGEGINRLFSGNPILEKATGKGALDDILFPSLGNTAGGRIVRSGVGEAIEEGAESIVDIGVQNIIMGDKADQKTAKDVGYDALIGLLVGGSTGGLSSIGRSTQNPAGKGAGTQTVSSEGSFTPTGKTGVQAVSGQNKTAPKVGAENARMSEDDLQDYLRVGVRQHVRDLKQEMARSGDSPILTTPEKITAFIKDAIVGKVRNTIKAYGKVGQRFQREVEEKSGGKTDISGYYLELDANRMQHLADHIKDDGDPRNIPLTEDQVLSIPEYIDNYDDVLQVVTHKDGQTRIYLGKQINGHSVVVVLASKGRGSVQPVTAWQNTTEHYLKKYGKEKTPVNTSQNPTASGGNESGYKPAPSGNGAGSTNPTSLAAAGSAGADTHTSPDSRITQSGGGVNVDPLLRLILGGSRVDQQKASGEQYAALADRGDIGMDAAGNLFQINPAEHIDQRTVDSVGSRKVNAFQFDHPHLHPYFQRAAEAMIADADISQQFGLQRSYERGMQGRKVNQQAQTSAHLRRAMDETGLSRNEIIDAAQRIVNDKGQENVKAAKQVEIILDDMLTFGWQPMMGETVGPNEAYIREKSEIAGSQPEAAQGEELPIMENDGIGAANAGFDPFTAAQNQYGTQESGENPVRSDDVPVSVNGETKVSHTIVTAKGAQVTPDEFVPLIENETMKGGFSFIPITNDQSVEAAKKYITDRGWPQARADWTADVRQGKAGDQITAIGALLYNNAVNSGDTRAALDILDDYQFAVRTSARGLQAARILKTLSPENRLYMIRRSIRRMVEDLKLGEDIQLPDNLVNAYMGAKTDTEVNNAVSDIQQYVADQLPSSLLDMWTALRYVNMLGNFKTQVRNVAGNVGMRAVSTAQNAVATFFEAVTGGRFGKTRSVFVDGSLKNAAKQDFQAVREQALSGGKYTLDEANSFAQGVKDKQKVFRGVLAPLEGYRKATNWAMNNQYFGDEGFIKGAYARYLAGYLKANGVTAEQFSDPQWQKANGDFVDKARSFAVQQAQEVTFRDSNTLSNWVSKFGRRSDTPTAVKMVSEGMMPFRKTPANVLLRAEEYSPLGIINTALEVAHKGLSKTKLTESGGRIGAYARSGAEVSGTDIINSLSKTLTGTGIFLTGMALASAGMLRGGGTGDDEQDAFDELTGHQDYSLILEDGTSITLDWLTPASMPLFMGAELERLRQEGGIELKDLEASLTSILEPMIQMSMMQGVNDTLNDLKYAQDANILQIAATAALGYLTQGLTNSLVGQVSRSTKEESMMTYVDKDSAIPAWLQREIGAASRKFPGEGYNQIPYIDAWGRTEATGDALERSVNNLFNPAYVSQVEVDELEAELQRLKDATGSTSVFPDRAEKSLTVNGETKNLTAEEYQKYATTLGQSSYALVKEGTSLAAYRAMNDAEKVKYVDRLYKYATQTAKAEMGGAALDGWARNAKNAQKDLGMSTAEYIALYQKYDGEGLSGNSYERTKAAVAAGLTVEEYFSMKNSADTDGSGRVTKEETIAVLAGLPNRVDLWDIICTTNANNPYA